MNVKSINSSATPGARLKVLLVDDNPDDRALVIRELRREAAVVAATEISNQTAFERALESGDFDLVITDFQLHWTTGLEILKQVAARHPDLPVIMFTGTGTKDVAVEAMRLGLTDYVVKNPRHMPRLRRAVHVALARSNELRARHRAEAALGDALQSMEDGFILFDSEDRLILCNEQIKRMYPQLAGFLTPGRKFEELLSVGIEGGSNAQTGSGDSAWLHERLAAYHPDSGSQEQRLDDGRWVLIKERRSHDGGRINIYTDITALKLREQQLEKLVSEHTLLAAATRQSVNGVLVIDVASQQDHYPVVYVNPAFEHVTGFSYQEVHNGDWRVFAERAGITPEVRERIRNAFRKQEALSLETVSRRNAGERYWISLSVSPVFDEQSGLRFYVAILADISERRHITAALEENARMLDEAEQLAQLGHWRWDIQTDRLWRSQESYRIRGMTPDSAPLDFRGTLQTFLAEDREMVGSAISGVAVDHQGTEVEARILRPDGEVRNVRIIAKYSPATAETGEAVFGVFQDITSQKQQEAVLRRSERRYRRLMESVPHGIAELSSDGVIRYANQAIHIMLGYARGDLIGKSLFEHVSNAGQRAECERRLKLMISGEVLTQSFMTQCRTVSGQLLDVQIDAVVSRDDTGSINGTTLVTTDITERVQSEQRLRYLAFYDALTRLGNRTLLHEHLREQLARRSGDLRVAVVLLNIDSFKMINDALGHAVGDTVLREFGTRLATQCGTRDGVARLSADEFGVVLYGEFDHGSLQKIVADLKRALEAPLNISGNRVDLRLSVGVAVAPDHGEEAEELLRNADSALLDAKSNAGGELRFYSVAMKTLVEELLKLRSHLRSASMEREFFLEYQPQVQLDSGRITGVEALLRWRTDDGSLIPPAKFIPVAEQSGDIISLGRWALEAACRQGMVWKELGIAPLPISVNVSARQFLRDDLVEMVNGVLQRTGLDSHWLHLELTETAIMTDNLVVRAQMEKLKALGISFSLDDFGTGYSSLSYLSRLPISILKIDRSFVVGMSVDAKHKAIVAALVAMSRTLGLTVVAEGVEESQQVENLRSVGCNLAQGNYYSRPVPAQRCTSLLRAGVLVPRH
ncbi:MAG TPA: EAL domain-containing protein [Gammaproteobacteria bacterium]|nr:EAL domain-containing protein [Gammaproteobacteria bacterium]